MKKIMTKNDYKFDWENFFYIISIGIIIGLGLSVMIIFSAYLLNYLIN
jgi:hypothetical protein